MSKTYTTLGRHRYHMVECICRHNNIQYTLKVFVNHKYPNSYWIVDGRTNQPIEWGSSDFPEDVRDDVYYYVLREIKARVRTFTAEIPQRAFKILGFTNTNQRNMIMFVLAETGNLDPESRHRYFVEFKPGDRLPYHFCTSNPVSNKFDEAGEPVFLDPDTAETFAAVAVGYLSTLGYRREQYSERQNSGLGDQILEAGATVLDSI